MDDSLLNKIKKNKILCLKKYNLLPKHEIVTENQHIYTSSAYINKGFSH